MRSQICRYSFERENPPSRRMSAHEVTELLSVFSADTMDVNPRGAVIMLGSSGSGKSTICNILIGTPQRMQDGKFVPIPPHRNKFETSSSLTASCTSVPIAAQVPGMSYGVVDTGGSNSISGPIRSIGDFYTRSRIAGKTATIQLCGYLTGSNVEERDDLFIRIFEDMVCFLSNNGNFQDAAIPGVSLIISKVRFYSRDDIEDLQAAGLDMDQIKARFAQRWHDLLREKLTVFSVGSPAHRLFDSVIKHKRYYLFEKPARSDNPDPIPATLVERDMKALIERAEFVPSSVISRGITLTQELTRVVYNIIRIVKAEFLRSHRDAIIETMSQYKTRAFERAALPAQRKKWTDFIACSDKCNASGFLEKFEIKFDIMFPEATKRGATLMSNHLALLSSELLSETQHVADGFDYRSDRSVAEWLSDREFALLDAAMDVLEHITMLELPTPQAGNMLAFRYIDLLQPGTHHESSKAQHILTALDSLLTHNIHTSSHSSSENSSGGGGLNLDVLKVFTLSARGEGASASSHTSSRSSDEKRHAITYRHYESLKESERTYPISDPTLILLCYEVKVIEYMNNAGQVAYMYETVSSVAPIEYRVLQSDFKPLPHWKLDHFPSTQFAYHVTTDHRCCTEEILTYRHDRWLGAYDPTSASTEAATSVRHGSFRLALTVSPVDMTLAVHAHGNVNPANPDPFYIIFRSPHLEGPSFRTLQWQLTDFGGIQVRNSARPQIILFSFKMSTQSLNNCYLTFVGDHPAPVVCGKLSTAAPHAKQLESVTIDATRAVTVTRLTSAPVLTLPAPPKEPKEYMNTGLIARIAYHALYPQLDNNHRAEVVRLTAEHDAAMATYNKYPMVFIGTEQVAGGIM